VLNRLQRTHARSAKTAIVLKTRSFKEARINSGQMVCAAGGFEVVLFVFAVVAAHPFLRNKAQSVMHFRCKDKAIALLY